MKRLLILLAILATPAVAGAQKYYSVEDSKWKIFLNGGIVHLKTDSRFLYEYTMSVVKANNLDILACSTDVYGSVRHSGLDPESLTANDEVTGVQTFYEKMFLDMRLPITYMAFVIDHDGDYAYPTDFDADYWRGVEGPRRSFSHQPVSKH